MNTNWKDAATTISTRALSAREAPLPLKEAAWRLVKFVAKCGRSNPISFALRPLASHKHLRTIVGVNIALIAIITALWGPIVLPSFAGPNTGGEFEIAVLPAGEVNLTTLESVRLPLDKYRLTQSYWVFHPGIDMATELGQPIHPVMAGQVTKVEQGRFGYGNNVVITHENGYESLYGHMSKIEVEEGDVVTTETEIGQVGSTGRSSGPHLHLEVRDDGHTINPKTLLEIK